MSVKRFIVEELESFIEGTGDKYAAQFGVPDAGKDFEDKWQKQVKSQAPTTPEDGELVGKIISNGALVSNIFKNPRTLKNFEPDVRAISDKDSNLYVAQIDGPFYHEVISNALKQSGIWLGSAYDYKTNMQWHRVDATNTLGYSISFSTYAQLNPEDTVRRIDDLQKKFPSLDFANDYHEDLKEGGFQMEGVGDKYAEKRFGIPDEERQFKNKGVPDADMGEKIVEIWASSFGGEEENHGWIYKNPKTLKGFDANVRAVATENGDLYVAQKDGYFIHADLELSLEKKIGFLDEVVELHRAGSSDTFGASDTLLMRMEFNGSDPYQFFKTLEKKHPQYKFSSDYYQDLREGTGDKYAAQFGVPDAGKEFEDRYQQHLKTQSQSTENGEAVASINLEKGNTVPDVIVYKNPKSLKNFDTNVRAVSDIDGNVYVAQLDGDFYHNHITHALKAKGIEIGDAYRRDQNMTWHRIYNMDMFGFSVSFINDYKTLMTGTDSEKREIEDRLRKVNLVNPTLKFVPAYWHDLSTGKISMNVINLLMKPFGK